MCEAQDPKWAERWTSGMKLKFSVIAKDLPDFRKVDIINLINEAMDEGETIGKESCPDCDNCDKDQDREPSHNEGMD